TGGNSTVRGLAIDNFAYGTGLWISGAGNDLVVGNFIGTDVTGLSAAANNQGAVVYGPGSTIGGTSPADRNIISGNNSGLPDSADGGTQPSGLGIYVGGGNLFQGNYVGVDKNGTSALPNGGGIQPGSNTTIGGAAAGAGNLISGNTGFAIDRVGNQNLIAG